MNFLRTLIFGMFFAGSASGTTIAQMQWISDGEGTGIFNFTVDGVLTRLLCDQFLPNAMTGPYMANVGTLAELGDTTLGLRGDSQALQKYQQVAILNLWARIDPMLALDAVWVSRRIVDGTGPLGPGAQTLFDLVMLVNPADYNLTGFRIYTGPLDRDGNPITQELTGFNDGGFDLTVVPEPSAMLLFGSGLAMIAVAGQRRRSR